MRLSTALWLIFLTAVGISQAAESKPAARKVQKIAVVALARDEARGSEVEAAVKIFFVEHKVAAESVRQASISKPANAKDLALLLKDQGYDSVLCMEPRKSIQIAPAEPAGKSALETCLSGYLSGNNAAGEPVDLFPENEVGSRDQSGGVSTYRAPIPSNPGAAPMSVIKATLRVFDPASGAKIWEAPVQAKIPAEMRTSFQTKNFAQEITKALTKSGLLP